MNLEEKIREISDTDFYISNLTAVKKVVLPPEPFNCYNNRVLYQRFFYIASGTIVFDDEKHKKLRFTSGDIIYLPSNVIYKSYWETEEKGEFIALNFNIFNSNQESLKLYDDLKLCYKDYDGKIYKQFFDIYELWKKSSRGYKLECISKLYSILNTFAQYSEKNNLKKKNRNILKAVLYLEDNYLTNVTIEELVNLSNINECQFRRSFKKLKGMSPIKYRNMLRLNKALEILKSGEYSVIEATMIVGFDDPAYFSRIFKEQFGHSPSYYIP